MSADHILSRDAEWQPASSEELLDRLDSTAQIRQLPVRYALAIDSRNMDDLAALFVADVQIGRDAVGRTSLKQWMTNALSKLDRTIHLVGNHVISFLDADHARGVVYCRDEVEENGEWTVGHLQYWDHYERRDGRWYFQRRHYNRWGVVDQLKRVDTDFSDHGLTAKLLPQAWPSWHRFWNENPKR